MTEKELLRRAMDSEPVPRDLEARVRARLDARQTSPWGRLVSSLAMLVLMIGGVGVYSIRRTGALLQVGIDDHVHCAVAGAYPHQTQKAEMVQGLGARFGPMLQPVLDEMAITSESVVSAHQCTVQGRQYVHIIVKREGSMLVSVILTRRAEGETFPGEVVARLVHASGINVRSGLASGYSVAGFESGEYLGYVVSGMPQPENQTLAARLAPVMARYTGA